MKDFLIVDAISCIDDDLIINYLENRLTYRAKRRVAYRLAIAIIASSLLLSVGVIPWIYDSIVALCRGELGGDGFELSEVKYEGRKIEKDEMNELLSKEKEWIISKISEIEEIPRESIFILKNGYHHITVTDKGNFINLNMITIPVINDEGDIIASITLFRSNDELQCQLNLGGAWSQKLNAIIDKYPNQKFLMMYIGDFSEAVITPDNSIHFLTGEVNFDGETNYYSAFYNEISVLDTDWLD